MRRALLALVLAPSIAAAQPVPVTLSAEEFQAVVTALAQRDPVLALLLRKQDAAQRAASTPVPQEK